ncbi:serine hydrolase domain-containing protein [Lactiplantibacillus plajomi]|uniref:Serine hydrolase domain-containing protein n=1 Tax=Lactiplantibacillus plajomi TaxID=1457217 RepID=A0ABV6K2R7_9LACO|nr:serine hydrolase domain-containing protein [Lactiplantibacillus plajomi]
MKRCWRDGFVAVMLALVVFLLGWGRYAVNDEATAVPVNVHKRRLPPVHRKSPSQSVDSRTHKTVTGLLTEAQALKQIDQLVKSHQIMGTLLLTTNGAAGVRIKTYGYADLATQTRNQPNEAYPLASLQKALTATVIQQLINQYKLKMTTPLSRFYPQIPYARKITIRQLLDHRSGIRMAEPQPQVVLPTETAQIDFTLRNLRSTGDHAYFYTNANFTLLAGVIRQVSHRSYMTMLRRTIIAPLGLKHTFAYNQIPGNVVDPDAYRLSNGFSAATLISKPLQSSELGCGSLYMSVGDYYRFMLSLQQGKLVGQAGLRELTSNFTPRYSGGRLLSAKWRYPGRW